MAAGESERARAHTHARAHTNTDTHTHRVRANLNNTRSRHTIARAARTYLLSLSLSRAGNAPAADLHSDVSPRPKRSSSGSIYLITPASRRIALAAGSLELNNGAGVRSRSFHIDSGRLNIKTNRPKASTHPLLFCARDGKMELRRAHAPLAATTMHRGMTGHTNEFSSVPYRGCL